jgi:predicted GNAT family acetyltransferase
MRARPVDAAEFDRLLTPLLAADEVRNTAPLGLAATLVDDPGQYPDPLLWLAEDDGGCRAGLLRTPPYHALVAGSREGIATLAAALAAVGVELPGVNGALPEAEWFAAAWGAATGGTFTVSREMRLHALSATEPVAPAPGAVRAAGPGDRAVMHEWALAFMAETHLQGEADQLARNVDAALGRELGALVWDDGGPVCMSLGRETTPGCSRIGPVYTPPQHRGRGYATALVAAHTEALLAAGTTTCMLFTDLANPTSNGIYARIGYRPVCDAAEIDF